MATKCRHRVIHFETGGFFLVCSECGYAWQAVGAEREQGPDFEAIMMPVRPGEERVDPFYVRPLKQIKKS
jgi:hypothetical protein